jgi:hypothetical protein
MEKYVREERGRVSIGRYFWERTVIWELQEEIRTSAQIHRRLRPLLRSPQTSTINDLSTRDILSHTAVVDVASGVLIHAINENNLRKSAKVDTPTVQLPRSWMSEESL